MNFKAVEDEIERQDFFIRAAENWSPQYRRNKASFKQLIKLEGKFERALRGYFRDFARRSVGYINWYEYNRLLYKLHASPEFEVRVLIEDGPIGMEDGFFIQIAYEPIEEGVTIGATAGEILSGKEIGISRTSDLVQDTAKRLVAQLVGKRVDENGLLVDNPKAKYRVTESVRKDIRSAIAKSLTLGEDQQTATARIQKAIKNPKRAAIIARTETVNAYQEGLIRMGKETGAVGKMWQAVNFEDICGDNARQGVIGIRQNFISGHSGPAAHPSCRCGLVMIYPEDPRAKGLLK
jgi:hypothetical protein